MEHSATNGDLKNVATETANAACEVGEAHKV